MTLYSIMPKAIHSSNQRVRLPLLVGKSRRVSYVDLTEREALEVVIRVLNAIKQGADR